ncbi:class I adenylate-forming enzyme family protein [Aromatoleum anaerobium]|uniref:AMP-binding protein n=1 Tax=Aromatoleum anaerobium TaxID=182180 RepID=A0ABX1PP24_9RHOO|nr:class I adenylate-forming enzyme family protein [Aromatoleum anaerobium]MCK0508012.1 acyl--CoA ligase [Aromatoleum anaerobium]
MTSIMDAVAKTCAQLLAPGAPFELTECEIEGRRTKIYRNAFATLPELIDAGRAHGDKGFLVYQGERWSFTRFFADVDAIATQLHAIGVKSGDRVAIAMRNRPEWAVAFAAAASLGAVPAPLNSFGLCGELRAGFADVDPAVLFCDAERFERIEGDSGVPGCRIVLVGAEPPPDAVGVLSYRTLAAQPPTALPRPSLGPDDPALILFTSGATSQAKGVLSSQRSVCQALFNIDFIGAISAMTSPQAVAAIMQRGFAPTTLTAVPLFHVSGLHAQLLLALRHGRRLVFMHRWDPVRALELICDEQVTQFSGAPSMVMQLLATRGFDDPQLTGSLGGLGFGGAGLPQPLIDEVFARRPDSMSGIGFGLTETNGVGAAASGELFRYKPRSSGLPSPIIDVHIADADGAPQPVGQQGEIWLRGVTVMQGYWRNPDASRQALVDGWFRTGDIGYVDDEGLLFVVDRIKDVINRSGEKIAAAEVESCLLEHPAVLEAAVFGVHDDQTGEAVAAAVVIDGGAGVTPEALRAHVASRIAGYKVPAIVHVRSEPLPRNPAGKLLKSALKREYPSADTTASTGAE